MGRNIGKLDRILLSNEFKWTVYVFFIILLFSINIFVLFFEFQWDFKIFYLAVKGFSNGVTPYKEIYLDLPYIYHPFTLYFFLPFTLFPYWIASFIFLLLKNASFLCLLYLWIFKFLERDDNRTFFLLFSLVAFNATFFIDLIAGNIATFESLLVWSGIYYLLKGKKLFVFCTFIIFISLFKLTPILLLFLLTVSKESKRYLYLFVSYIGFCLLFLLPMVFSPVLFEQYISYLFTAAGEIDPKNPSTLSLLSYLMGNINTFGVIPWDSLFAISLGLYIGIIIIIILTLLYWKENVWKYQKKHIQSNKREKIIIFLLCLIYGLIIPRFKDYSYILLILPTYYLIRTIHSPADEIPERLQNNFLLILFILSSYKFLSVFYLFLLDYNILISIYILFVFYIFSSYRDFYIKIK